MLSLNLTSILKARQVQKPYSYLVQIGISPATATKMVNDRMRVFRLDHIELLCKELHCEPNDLLVYQPNSNNKLPENHPLNKLLLKEDNTQWQETLKTIPLKQLKEIAAIIAQSKPENSKP
jgi:DNA-binding Xre family transcriptional regulator